jgi:hypothetical protein
VLLRLVEYLGHTNQIASAVAFDEVGVSYFLFAVVLTQADPKPGGLIWYACKSDVQPFLA